LSARVGSYTHTEKLPSSVVVPAAYQEQQRIHAKIRERNKAIDRKSAERKKQWSFQPPDPMNLFLMRDCGEIPAGLVISVCQRVGAVLLSRRMAHIYASDGATADVVLTGTYEDLAEGLGL
jgi:acyl-CoA thioesterase